MFVSSNVEEKEGRAKEGGLLGEIRGAEWQSGGGNWWHSMALSQSSLLLAELKHLAGAPLKPAVQSKQGLGQQRIKGEEFDLPWWKFKTKQVCSHTQRASA